MANTPELIVFDECTSSLDPTARAQIIDLLIDLQKQLGVSYLFISHDLTTVRYISKYVAVMYLGRIVEQGSTEDIFARPRHPYTRALLGSVFEADPAKRHEVTVLRGEIPSPINLPHGCYFYSRCPIAKPECQQVFPPFVHVGDGHISACYRATEDLWEVEVSGHTDGVWDARVEPSVAPPERSSTSTGRV